MSDEPLAALLHDAQERARAAQDFYDMLARRRELKSHRAIVYRCATSHRCLLADVLRTRHGLLIHQPRYKLSPAVNEASSSASGRAKNTEDGDRRWRAHTFFEHDAVNVSLSCDHVRSHVVDLTDIHNAIAADTRTVRV